MAIRAGTRIVKARVGSKGVIYKSVKTLKTSSKKASANGDVVSHILSGPKGPRAASHRRIKEAVEKVFRERAQAHG